RMHVYVREGESNRLSDWSRIHVWPISSGLPGGLNGQKIATPTGVYKFDPSRFREDYKSAQFEFADMYESMFLYHQYAYQSGDERTGIPIHGTYLKNKLGRRDSGGCIRLAREKSQCLFYTLKGEREERCLDGGKLRYWGRVPSFLPRNAEADPEYLTRSGLLEVGGYRVLVAIFNDTEDKL
ncbi:MAG: L,D-transpeptidase, partial [Bdellovibrionales bacterium]|nr:L,D-transpeptidase [Bdellovibrionales bacterium]NQZ19976.1 L,D-transpeptidase [Bdellovibrionales bacterium]